MTYGYVIPPSQKSLTPSFWHSTISRRFFCRPSSRQYRHHDNLGNHNGEAGRQLIHLARAKLFFLPKYSPDLNPIKGSSPNSNICSEKSCRANGETVYLTLHDIHQAFTPDECAN
jgi:hypothetical protein